MYVLKYICVSTALAALLFCGCGNADETKREIKDKAVPPVKADIATNTDLTASQQYTWNGKVNISYNIIGDLAAEEAKNGNLVTGIKISAIDRESNLTYIATKLTGDTGYAAGEHACVWDMNKQGITPKSTNFVFSITCETKDASYCVIDLHEGSTADTYPVTCMDDIPDGSWSDEYKTTKLVLKRIPAGSFIMGKNQTDESHRVTLTKPFFIGIFDVTQKQWELVMGDKPTQIKGDTLAVGSVTYNMIRGSTLGAQWPANNKVDSDSFLGKLRARTGCIFDLPTEAQWEYTCRAGTTTDYCYGDVANGEYMWYYYNSGSRPHTVGTKMPNPWGVYDMHGSMWEWCLDWYSESLGYGFDPKGASSGAKRVDRGGSYPDHPFECTSHRRSSFPVTDANDNNGFRLSWTLP